MIQDTLVYMYSEESFYISGDKDSVYIFSLLKVTLLHAYPLVQSVVDHTSDKGY